MDQDPNNNLAAHYHLRLAAAHTRGKLGNQLPTELRQKPFLDLSLYECETIFKQGQAARLKLHKFKRSATLPRVRKTRGILKSLQPENVLDIGTGRGVFLWPLLDTFGEVRVTCVDLQDHRAADIKAVADGGEGNLQALVADAARLPFRDKSFDGICLLETLEHVEKPRMVVKEVCRVAGRFVLLSVPSKPDNNPGHLHLFDGGQLRELVDTAGGFSIRIEFVLNHIVALAIRK